MAERWHRRRAAELAAAAAASSWPPANWCICCAPITQRLATCYPSLAWLPGDVAPPIGPGSLAAGRLAAAGGTEGSKHCIPGEPGRRASLSCSHRHLRRERRQPVDRGRSSLLLQEFLGHSLPPSVTIVEVGPRDGLQNEKEKVRRCNGHSSFTTSCCGVVSYIASHCHPSFSLLHISFSPLSGAH